LLQEFPGKDLVEAGISAPGVALTGGLVELELLVESDDEVIIDQELAFSTTRKNIRYWLSPISGRVAAVNPQAAADGVNEAPAETWLLRIATGAGWDERLVDAPTYAARLAGSEHATPEAVQAAQRGKGSPTCKSIYSGIKEG